MKSTIAKPMDTGDISRTSISTLEKADWNRRYSSEDFVWKTEPNRLFAKEVKNLTPGRALDLAAGEGRNAIWLAENDWTVTAVDFADVALLKGKRLASERQIADLISFHEADLRNYDPSAGSFDLVAIIYFQIPIEELLPILTKAVNALAKGGTFLLIAHDPTNLTLGIGGPRNPSLLYSADQIVAAVNKYLSIKKSEAVERIVDTIDGERVAIDFIVRGNRL